MDFTHSPSHVSLCAGYAGIDLGLHRVVPNLRTIAACEIEAFAVANLVAKMEEGLLDPAPVWTDLKTFPWAEFRDRVCLLSGGYPCQPFSSAGKRLGSEDPRHLWPFIRDGIELMRPDMCFFENVEGHISLGLSAVLADLEAAGYRCAWGIFSAAEVGLPHRRKRVFILACRNETVGRNDYSDRLRGLVSRETLVVEKALGRVRIQNNTQGEDVDERLPSPNGDNGSKWDDRGSHQSEQAGQPESESPGGPALDQLAQQDNETEQLRSSGGAQSTGQWEVGGSDLQAEEETLPWNVSDEGRSDCCVQPSSGYFGNSGIFCVEDMAHRIGAGLEGFAGHVHGAGRQCDGSRGPASEGCVFPPARPGDDQFWYEPPRVLADNPSERRGEGRTEHGGQQGRPDASERREQLADGQCLRKRQREGAFSDVRRRVVHCREEISDGSSQSALGRAADEPSGRLVPTELFNSVDARIDELRLLGNGVVPAVAARAFTVLLTQLLQSTKP